MYFLNEEEKLYLNKGLIPQSREMYIDNDLRGWNWNRPPIEPVYDIKLAVYEVANNYCSTNKDLYLRRVLNIENKVNDYMIEGSVLHNTIFQFITFAKREFYNLSIKDINMPEIIELSDDILDKLITRKKTDFIKENLKRKVKMLWNFERQRVIFRMQELISRQPYIGNDSLVYQVIPVVVEQKLNGSFLGLSPYLSADALNFSEPMIVDIKFGSKKDFHKLSVTGYSMVMESLYSFPVNLGCVVYPSFKDERILIDRELFIIDDELRQSFIENRDEKMRMIYEEIDPGVSENCYKNCPYWDECKG